MMSYLDGLNERQKQAVTTTNGPLLVLAGAGAGKTKVLTTRIYHLIREGVAPEKILAVTFTNKAAREMQERVGQMLDTTISSARGIEAGSALPLVTTFHRLGRYILREFGNRIGISRFASIYDRDDSKRVVRELLKDRGIDPKELSPGFVLGQISKAKGAGMSADEFKERQGGRSFHTRTVAELWPHYERALREEKALDFDDLITLPLKLLEEHADVREALQKRFSHVHIDEYQDTNELQGRLANILARNHRNIFVVGDIDQCLVAGTKVLMANGTKKSIEDVREGDSVLSNYGSGDMRPARVIRSVSKESKEELVTITTTSGRVITSTPEHIHFSGYKLGITPQTYFVYLMQKKGAGWRLGVSQVYTNGQRQAMPGFQQRCNQEHGDYVWIIGTYTSSQKARVTEYITSLTYGIPTIPFVARKGSFGGYVHDQKTINSIFASFDTESAAKRLLDDRGLSIWYPHHRAQSKNSNRRNVTVTLCGDRRSRTAMHRIAMVGNDEEGREILMQAGFSVRPAKLFSKSWRFETAHADYASLEKRLQHIQTLFPTLSIQQNARLGGQKKNLKDANSLPFLPAGSVLPGMVLFDENGGYDVVKDVERILGESRVVYDLNVAGTHNFIANGLTTHNCIYTWRNATIDNLLRFDETYPEAKTIVLEHNYRSTKTIVAVANAVIEKNRNRKEKTSVTDNAVGEKITLFVAHTAEEEARYVAKEYARRIRIGERAENLAVLFRTNFQSRLLEESFLQEGVPYRLLGTRFFERKEVKDMLAWIRLSLDPSREADRIRAMQSPSRGIGKVTLGKIIAGKLTELRSADRAKVDGFEKVRLGLSAESERQLPSAFVRLVIEKSGMRDTLIKGGEEGEERLENVQELATIATRYDHLPPREGLELLVADAALASDQDELDRPDRKAKTASDSSPDDSQSEPSRGVTLMTVHAAKGLEFDTVCIVGLEEGLFPHAGMDEEDRDQEEERRLFYVALTRARQKLYLTLARVRRIYGTDYLAEPSSFLGDIDAGYLHMAPSMNAYEDTVIEI